MTIINSSSKNMTPSLKYLLTKNPSIITVKNLEDGAKITVAEWCIYKDTNANGDEVELLSFIDKNNQGYATQSETFKKSFNDILEIMDGNTGFTIVKMSGTTKKGRSFVNCGLC